MKKNIKINQHKTKDDIDVLRNQLARALADYDNLRKRTESERENLVRYASLNLIVKLLPIYDMLEDAQKHLKDPDGIELIKKGFYDVLASEGIEKIEVRKGDIFNENYHEVVDVDSSVKGEKGKILEVSLSGWKYRDGDEQGKVIRPAKIRVIG